MGRQFFVCAETVLNDFVYLVIVAHVRRIKQILNAFFEIEVGEVLVGLGLIVEPVFQKFVMHFCYFCHVDSLDAKLFKVLRDETRL